jgi:ribosomal protein L11 methyltransferase
MDNWTQLDIFTTTAGIEPVSAMLLELGLSCAVQDAQDFERFLAGKEGHWDYIEDSLMKLRDVETTLQVYLADNQQGAQTLAEIEAGLARLRALDADAKAWGRLVYASSTVREQDWANAWKQYYAPIKVGEKLVVCPSWEEVAPLPDEVVLRMDPGMAFGTGSHASTRLCMRLLEQACLPDARMLDLGTGSGILAVSACLLGARSALGVDIDQNAVDVARENARQNGVAENTRFLCGDLLAQVQGRFDLICVNIVADVIIPLLPALPPYMQDGGVVILSGIIDTRAQDVLDALPAAGFAVDARLDEDGWVALRLRRNT